MRSAVPGRPAPIYQSPEDLLRKTPEFARKLFHDRLDGYFEGVYRHIEDHFGGQNPYLAEIRRHIDYIRQVIETGNKVQLRRQPESINAHVLRGLLGVKLGERRSPRVRLRGLRTRRAKVSGADYVPV